MLFALLEISVNHELLFRPGFDFLIWQLWAPLLFVAGGVQMAPKLKLGAFLVVGGLKIGVATTNFARDLWFVHGGGLWSAVDPTTNSPVWWNAIVYTLCIASRSTLGFTLAKQAMRKRSRQSVTAVPGGILRGPHHLLVGPKRLSTRYVRNEWSAFFFV